MYENWWKFDKFLTKKKKFSFFSEARCRELGLTVNKAQTWTRQSGICEYKDCWRKSYVDCRALFTVQYCRPSSRKLHALVYNWHYYYKRIWLTWQVDINHNRLRVDNTALYGVSEVHDKRSVYLYHSQLTHSHKLYRNAVSLRSTDGFRVAWGRGGSRTHTEVLSQAPVCRPSKARFLLPELTAWVTVRWQRSIVSSPVPVCPRRRALDHSARSYTTKTLKHSISHIIIQLCGCSSSVKTTWYSIYMTMHLT